MGQVTIVLDEPTEVSSAAAARAAGVPLAAWLADLVRRHVGDAPPSAPAGAAAVLVVEDNPVCREVLRCQVEFLGWRADTAENGAEALALLARGNYRLLLTDCRMPVMDGFQLVRAIRAGERRRQGARLPVVAVTSENLAADGNGYGALGIDDYLDKSLDEQALARVLAKWLGAAAEPVHRPGTHRPTEEVPAGIGARSPGK